MLHILKVNFSLLLMFIISLNPFCILLLTRIGAFICAFVLKLHWRFIFKEPLCYSTDLFICPTKFSNSALLFGSYVCCVGLRVIAFFDFRTFRSTPYFRHNAQLFFCFLPSSSVLVFHFILGSEAIGRFTLQVFCNTHRYFIL